MVAAAPVRGIRRGAGAISDGPDGSTAVIVPWGETGRHGLEAGLRDAPEHFVGGSRVAQSTSAVLLPSSVSRTKPPTKRVAPASASRASQDGRARHGRTRRPRREVRHGRGPMRAARFTIIAAVAPQMRKSSHIISLAPRPS